MDAVQVNLRRGPDGKMRAVSRYNTKDGKIVDGGKVISIQTGKALQIRESNDNYTSELSKFTIDIVNWFNGQYRTKFQVYMVQHNGYGTKTSLTKGEHTITVSFGSYGYKGACTQDRIDAVKLDIAHALCHYLYANMSISFIKSLATIADKVAGNYRKVIMQCCIETAADIHAKFLCSKLGMDITDNIYAEYINLMCHDQVETLELKRQFLNKGLLPPTTRIEIMQTNSSFTANDWEVLDLIIDSYGRLNRELLGRRDGIRDYRKWIRGQLELINFPTRINRIRK